MSISTLTSQRPVSKAIQKKTKKIVQHVVDMIDPLEIYLIGSMMRGVIHDHSDLDLVVVVREPFKKQDLVMKVLPKRPHVDLPLDLHLIGKSEFLKYKDKGGISFEGAHHGKLVYRGAER